MFPWLGQNKQHRAAYTENRQESGGASAINSIGARAARFRWEQASVQNKEACHERLCREKDGVALCDYPGPSSRQLEFDAPLGLQLTGGPSGAPDLRLNLISLRAGADVQAAWTCKRRRSSLARKAPLLADAAGFAGRAAGLLFLQLIFPDSLPPHLKYLALAGSVSAATRLVGLARSRRRGSTVSRLKQHGHAAAADLRRAAPWLVDGTASTARWLDAYGIPAFALMLGATLWSWFNPVSYHVLRCVAAAIPLAAGYAQTARDAARGVLPEGPAVEEAWRRRHKWAAQRVAHLMNVGLYDKPPLEEVVRVAQTLSINVGLMVEGVGLLGEPLLGVASESSTWGAAPSGARCWMTASVDASEKPPQLPPGVARAPPPWGAEPAAAKPALPSHAASRPAVTDVVVGTGHLPTAHRPAVTGHPAVPPVPAALQPSGLNGHSRPQLPTPSEAAPSQRRPAYSHPPPVDSRWPHAPPGNTPGSKCEAFHTFALPTIVTASELTDVYSRGATAPTSVAEPTTPPSSLSATARPLLPAHAASAQHSGRNRARSILDSPSDYRGADRGTSVVPVDKHQAMSSTSRAPPANVQAAMMRLQQDAASASPFASAEAQQQSAPLPLFGQGDHGEEEDAPWTPRERWELGLRAAFLFLVFLPFLLLGPLLLLLAAVLTPAQRSAPSMTLVDELHAPAQVPRQNGQRPRDVTMHPSGRTPQLLRALRLQRGPAASPTAPSPLVPVLDRPRDSLDGLGLRRALTGAGLSLDVAGTAQKAAAAERVDDANAAAQTVTANKPAGKPVVVKGGLLVAAMRRAAFRLLLVGIRAGGAAFIKWGQWSATREDIFPEDLCQILSELHDRAPVHGWEASKREIEAAFGRSLEDLFVCIDQKPLASGSIAQVHRATMHIDGAPREVVVKVRHPGVARRIHQDFQLLKPLAAATSRVRSLKGLSLKESVSQFSHTMTAQADLRVEAAHLRRFYNNFAAVRNSVTPPYPLPGYETEAVLIETYEPGDSVSKYIRSPTPFNTKIVGLGVDTYLKMLLEDNFVHTDLHPGNILVRVRGQEGVGDGAGAEVRDKLQLILLDFGLAEELTPRVRKHFISFLHMITSGNGRLAAYHMLRFGRKQECPNPVAFADDMELLFRRDCNIHAPEGIDVDKVLKAVLHVARQHEVTIDSSYAALVIGVCIIVGFATSMDPRVNLLDAATPAFLYHQLTGQAQGRLYS